MLKFEKYIKHKHDNRSLRSDPTFISLLANSHYLRSVLLILDLSQHAYRHRYHRFYYIIIFISYLTISLLFFLLTSGQVKWIHAFKCSNTFRYNVSTTCINYIANIISNNKVEKRSVLFVCVCGFEFKYFISSDSCLFHLGI